MNPFEAQLPPEQPNVAPEEVSGAALLTTPGAEAVPALPALHYQPAPPPEPLLALPPLPEVRSKDGRVVFTDTSVTVQGRQFSLRELERAEITPVKWILWYLLGGLGLAFVMIAFLQNQLRTGPAMLGMVVTALLLAYGHRGTNRLRLHRLGREMVNFALPGDTPPWVRLTAELNRRIYRVHDYDARQAAALLAAADEAARQASLAAQTTAANEATANNNPLAIN